MAALTVTLVAIATPSSAQELQSATVRLIHSASCPSEHPIFEVTDSGHRTERFAGTQDPQNVWDFTFQVSPGTYYLNATIPYRDGHAGCVYLTRFTILPGHDRHLVGALAPASSIGGENYDRSTFGILPFPGMNVTIQPVDSPNAPEMLVPVDGTMYDAELLGPHRYLFRFYLTPQDMEGLKSKQVVVDLRKTAPLTKVRRDLTIEDLSSALHVSPL